MAIRLGALHPYSSSVALSLEQSPAIRMKLTADVMLGVMAEKLWKLRQLVGIGYVKHSCGKSPCLMGQCTINGDFP